MTDTINTPKPILFSGPMVRAILEGRKTQTRRIVKPQPLHDGGRTPRVNYDDHGSVMSIGDSEKRIACPYGRPGTRLWVRETFFEMADPLTSRSYDPPKACYRATNEDEVICDDGDGFAEVNKNGTLKSPWKPAIHMPRWASRITLEVTGVRVERLQDISREDVIAEGITERDGAPIAECVAAWHEPYAALWNTINGPGSWEKNDWVWVVEFKRIEEGESA